MDTRVRQYGIAATQKPLWRRMSTLALLHPTISLILLFWAWKALLFAIIVNSPGSGYDTSTTLLPFGVSNTVERSHIPRFSSIFLRFVRWDSIYFVQIAERGYLFEQEWAFGCGYAKLLSLLSFCTSPFSALIRLSC
jgi:Mannosyltransferase (PIG-V)